MLNLWNDSYEVRAVDNMLVDPEGVGRCDFVRSCLESAIALSEEVARELDTMQIDYTD